MPASQRNSACYIQFLTQIEATHPVGNLYLVTDNLSSHLSLAVRTWLADHPRLNQVFIPKGACWLNLQEGWWRLLRKTALAGQTFADSTETALAVQVATSQLNARAKPWVWGRPQMPPRYRRRSFVYHL